MNKHEFLSTTFPALLQSISSDTPGKWGKLSVQGMIEHMAESVDMAYAKGKANLVTPAEFLEKARSFALSPKAFKPETKNVLMSEQPAALKYASKEEAISALKMAVQQFESYYANHPNETVLNPFFGELNYEEWTHLLHKHAVHHLNQFGLDLAYEG